MVLTSGTAATKELKRDPDTGMIRVLYVGAPFMASPYWAFKTDPLLATTPVDGNLFGIPATEVERAMRLYMPRTKQALVTGYDVIGLDDTTCKAFRQDLIQWMVDGCIDDGQGIFMAGGFESFWGWGFPSWSNTVLDRVLPVDCDSHYILEDARNVLTDKEDEFMRSIPWDEYDQHSIFWGYNVVMKRPEARQLSYLAYRDRTDPGWVWWDVGEGRFFASACGFRGGSAGAGFIRWRSYPDFVCNLVYFLAGLKPPSDINLLHAVRDRLRDILDERQVVSGTIDFVSRFGADTRNVDRKLSEAEAELKQARAYYVDLDLEQSRAKADDVFKLLEDAYELALDARDAALFWIFLTEWLVVTGTGLICGLALWTLMIRRKLFKEVKVTRGKEA